MITERLAAMCFLGKLDADYGSQMENVLEPIQCCCLQSQRHDFDADESATSQPDQNDGVPHRKNFVIQQLISH